MAHMWKVGDKAVCIKEGEWLSSWPDGVKRPFPYPSPKKMETVCITGVRIRKSGELGLIISGYEGLARDGSEINYTAVFFRPIVKADDDFIAQMRALKPKVKQYHPRLSG